MSLPRNVFDDARILIVDDDEMSAAYIARVLETGGRFQVRIVTDSREALSAVEEFHPDILLLDLIMPHIDGFDVMEQLRTVVPEENYFPILVLTGDDAPETRLRALTFGAKDFLQKPVLPSEMIARIRNLLETRFLHLELQSQNMLLEEHVRERTEQLEATLTRLHATQTQVVKQERLGALGVMASGIAHDFNNSLTTILGYGELLLEHPTRTEYLRKVMMAGQDARQTVRRLREFYKTERQDEPLAAVNLNALVEHAVSLTMPRWSNQALAEGIRIVVKTELSEVPLIAGNPAELREVLANLIFNAVDALPKGGTIRLRTRVEEDNAVLVVSDNGVGMDEHTSQRCLEPFFSTKGEGGTGLGLSVVHGIVTRHGGTMEIESAPGCGTSFTLSFPATELGVAFQPPAEAPALERSLRILVVDDQPIICELIAELLRSDGHIVDTEGGGGAALERCRKHDYDLVVTDLAMPGMNGEQLADVMKQLRSTTPVILLTGFGDLFDIADDCTPSIDLVVTKPATLSDLRQAIFAVMTRDVADTIAA